MRHWEKNQQAQGKQNSAFSPGETRGRNRFARKRGDQSAEDSSVQKT
jgi:hypothetical protein